jgi:WD40 repeat protein
MHEANIDLNKLEKVFTEIHELFLESLDPKEFELYIEPQVKDRETGAEFSAFARLDSFIVQADAASMLVAGDSGMGKTLLSRQIAKRAWYLFIRENIGLLKDDYWTEALTTYEKQGFGTVASILSKAEEKVESSAQKEIFNLSLPIWLWMPSLCVKGGWESQLLERHLKRSKTITLLKQASQQGICRLFPIMDGWDELSTVSENLYLKSGFWDEAGWPYIKVLSTCRPEAFIHYEKSGGYKSIFHPRQGVGTYTILNLCPFEARHIQAYIECYVKTLPVGYQPEPIIGAVQPLKQPGLRRDDPWNQEVKEKWMTEYNEIYAPISAQKTIQYPAATSDEKGEDPIEADSATVEGDDDCIKEIWMTERRNIYAATEAAVQVQQCLATDDEQNNNSVGAEVLDIEQSQSHDWAQSEAYVYHIARIQGLEQIVQTPFVLSAIVQVLPRIVIQRQREEAAQPIITRYKIYEYFVDHWLNIQAKRLWQDEEKQKLELNDFFVPGDEDQSIAKLKACLLTYSENLARLALNLGGGKLEVHFNDSDTLDPNLVIPVLEQELHFKNELDFNDTSRKKLRLIRSACLLKNLNNTGCDLYLVPALLAEDNISPDLIDCYFYLTEETPAYLKRFFYLNSHGKYESITILEQEAFEAALMKIMSGFQRKYLMPDEAESLITFTEGHSRGSFKFLHKSLVEFLAAKTLFLGAHAIADSYLRRFDLEQDLSQLNLNHHLLTNAPNIIHLLADKVRDDAEFKYLLYQIIELSKGERNVEKAAANAITILNVAGESFSGRDFRAIHIRGAILNGALCGQTDFEGADLRDVEMHNIWLSGANLKYAQLNGLDFQELPRIKCDTFITKVCIAPNGEWVLIGDVTGHVGQYSYPAREQLQKWYCKPYGLLSKAVSLIANPIENLVINRYGRLAACSNGSSGNKVVHVIDVYHNHSVARLIPPIVQQAKFFIENKIGSISFCGQNDKYILFSINLYKPDNTSEAICYLQLWHVHRKRLLAELKVTGHVTQLVPLTNTILIGTVDGSVTLFSIDDSDVNQVILSCVSTFPIRTHLLSQNSNKMQLAYIQYKEEGSFDELAFDLGGEWGTQAQLCVWDLSSYEHLHYSPMLDRITLTALLRKTHNIIPLKGIRNIDRLTFHVKGKLLAGKSRTHLYVWDLSSYKLLYSLPISDGISLFEKTFDETATDLYFFPNINTLKLRLAVVVEKTFYVYSLSRAVSSLCYPRNFTILHSPFLKRILFSGNIYDLDNMHFFRVVKSTPEKISIENKLSGEQWTLAYPFPSIGINRQQSHLVILNDANGYEFMNWCSKFGNGILMNMAVQAIGAIMIDHSIRIWNLKNGKLCFKIKHAHPHLRVLFSADGEWLVNASKEIFIHRLEDGKQLKKFMIDTYVSALALSADKTWLAVADINSGLSIFDVETQQCLAHIPGLPIMVRELDLTVNGQYLVGKGKKSGELIFRVIQKENNFKLQLISNSVDLNLVCSNVQIEAAEDLSEENHLLLQQNNAYGTPAPCTQLAFVAEEKESEQQESIAIAREFNFDRAVVKRDNINSFFRKHAGLNYDVWQVALVRDAKAGKNSKHAFILVEGMNAFGRCFFWRFDLATEVDGQKVKEGFAEIVFRHRNDLLLLEREAMLQNFLNFHEIEGRGLKSLVGHVWQLRREKVLDLYRAIMTEKSKGLLLYAFPGNQSFFATGDNCYSWARRHLLALKDKKIEKDLPSSIVDYFGMNPAWKLQDSLIAPRHVRANPVSVSSMSI